MPAAIPVATIAAVGATLLAALIRLGRNAAGPVRADMDRTLRQLLDTDQPECLADEIGRFDNESTWNAWDLVVFALLVVLLVYVPTLKWFGPGRWLYLRRPNRYRWLHDLPGIDHYLPPSQVSGADRPPRADQTGSA